VADLVVPETLEGWSVLHQMFRLRRRAAAALSAAARREVAAEACGLLSGPADRDEGATALVQQLGHKGDLMLIHFRRSFDALAAVEAAVAGARLADLLEPSWSYVSVVELGLYEMTAKIHQQLAARGLEPDSDAYREALDAELEVQRRRLAARLYPELPRRRHVCFYPMNKRRGEAVNWYRTPFAERAEMMREHGLIGRRYGGAVTQIISGSIGLDDWEWGVDLFADDPVVFKKLIYEMRFDRASAEFAEFGPFHVGLQFPARELGRFLDGDVPGPP
jgi:chlorite dismutase